MHTSYKKVMEDNFRITWRRPDGSYAWSGKRVSKDCPITYEERRAYVKHGPIPCIKLMMKTRNIGLTEAWPLLKKERGKVTHYQR